MKSTSRTDSAANTADTAALADALPDGLPNTLQLSATIVRWYQDEARELPWRNNHVCPWGILVSEFMLQQTQVDRVLPRWLAWMERWPTPTALAAADVKDAIIAWDRLGYPRRALWLHQAATAIVENFSGEVPDKLEDLLSLKGVGEYTARAVAVFAHHQRHPVVDTNVRRVTARLALGQAEAGLPNPLRDQKLLEHFLPTDAEQARQASYAMMEFGAVVCIARAPRCNECPLRKVCSWAIAGFPSFDGKKSKPQATFHGSDRQARGKIMAELRGDAHSGLSKTALFQHLTELEQAERALQSLLRDGLVIEDPQSKEFRLPT
ncbi:MAG: A/G-specific adenine glycosylase [Microbacteriaceae bacterium]